MKIKQVFSKIIADLKVSAQTKTFWVAVLGAAILVGQFVYVTVFSGNLPDGLTGILVGIANGVISMLIASGLIKNTNGDDLTAAKLADEKAKADKLLKPIGLTGDQLKALVESAEVKGETNEEK